MTDQRLTDLARSSMPFTVELGLTIDEGSTEQVVGRASWTADRCTVGGALHGGYLMALADSVGALCAFLNLPEGAGTSTIESKTNFLRAVTEGDVTITARPLHVGRTTVVVVTDVTRSDGKLVTRTTQTQAILPGG